MHPSGFIFPYIYDVPNMKELSYFSATDLKSMKDHKTLGILQISMQTCLPDRLQFESERMDRNFELSSFTKDYCHPPHKTKVYVETLKNKEIQQYHPECSEKEEIFATYLKQEKFQKNVKYSQQDIKIYD